MLFDHLDAQRLCHVCRPCRNYTIQVSTSVHANRLKIGDPRMKLFLESAGKVRGFIGYAVDHCRVPDRVAMQLAAA
ncbi:hypothetical protein [Burkholderia sp. AU45388]|uniref:hypothetical protein n=1 Tax=Burkholderia sp. AU45388 TaxID=3059206 RepID=UPI00264B8426|nr:hypothetical protein [Burkholderia sp. AU45388]MDN7427374.1 hypothetical protein [Burkholderia sp. AU45388]